VRQMMVADGASRDSPIRPVIRTFYDHMQVLLQHNAVFYIHFQLPQFKVAGSSVRRL
jgi:hypothetical protein